MGELSKAEAEVLREKFKKCYEQVKEDVTMNVEDMDFENADKKEDMEEEAKKMTKICDVYIDELDRMTFL